MCQIKEENQRHKYTGNSLVDLQILKGRIRNVIPPSEEKDYLLKQVNEMIQVNL